MQNTLTEMKNTLEEMNGRRHWVLDVGNTQETRGPTPLLS